MNNFLKTIFYFCLTWIFSVHVVFGLQLDNDCSKYSSVELQLLGIRLGAPYLKTKEQLTQKYGMPKSGSIPSDFDVFSLDKETDSVLLIFPGKKDSSLVGAIQVNGTHPVKGLDFFADINLGDPEGIIPFLFPKAVAEPELKDGYRHYSIPQTNYAIEAKNGMVAIFRIWDEYTIPIKVGKKSIALTENLFFTAAAQGLLQEPIDIDKLSVFVDDPLRQYCQNRYPLRQARDGKTSIDINLFQQNKKDSLLPATFILDTGCSITTISPKMCQKIQCKHIETVKSKLDSSSYEIVSGGTVGIGYTHVTTNVFGIVPPAIFKYHTKLDGILGANTLSTPPLFINFKQGYLCFPTVSLSQVSQILDFKKLEADYSNLTARAHFYVNNQAFSLGTLDSGADVTTLLEQDIARLNLTEVGEKTWHFNIYGSIQQSKYGPVEVGWPSVGITQKLAMITKTTVFESPMIGIDFLRYYVLGLDHQSKVFYLGG